MHPENYAKLLYEVLENKPTKQQGEVLERFKKILVQSKESHLAQTIKKKFTKIQEYKEQERTTYIASALKLTVSQKKELEKITSEPREFSVNENLLAGIAIRNKDMVYNGTLRKKLEHIKSSL